MPSTIIAFPDQLMEELDRIVATHNSVERARPYTLAERKEASTLSAALGSAAAKAWLEAQRGTRFGRYTRNALVIRLLTIGLEHFPEEERSPG